MNALSPKLNLIPDNVTLNPARSVLGMHATCIIDLGSPSSSMCSQ
jgi:hypothetical protein